MLHFNDVMFQKVERYFCLSTFCRIREVGVISRRLTQEEFEKKFYMKYSAGFKVVGCYKNAQTPVDVQCTKCGYIISHTPNHYDKGTSKCPVCNINGDTHKTILGVNDMWSTHPYVAQWLGDPNDGYIYRINTLKELDFVCPNCHKHRNIRPNGLKNGFVCCYCSNGIKYPNKFMANVLKSCNVAFRTEFHFKDSNYKYDFYFNYNNRNYLIEMDGGYGHGNVDTPNATMDEQILIDKAKDELAYKNNYILIRIDCNYDRIENRYDYISNNISKSILGNLFILTESIFKEANTIAQQNDLLKFVNSWNNGVKSYDEFFKVLNVNHRSTVRSYAKRAIELQLLNISYDDFLKQIRLASNNKLAQSKGFPVLCEQTNEVFYSISEAERKMGVSSLRSYFHNNNTYCGKLSDGTKLTWRIINKEEYQKYISNINQDLK